MIEIIAVYQDCVLCGTKGRQKIADYAAKGVQIRKVGFTTEEGKKLIHEAVLEHGIGYMPFYVLDGEFAESIEALIAKKPANKTKKTQKIAEKADKSTNKNKKVAKETKDGSSADN